MSRDANPLYEKHGRVREFNPPGWASLIALVIYATVLVWAVAALA